MIWGERKEKNVGPPNKKERCKGEAEKYFKMQALTQKLSIQRKKKEERGRRCMGGRKKKKKNSAQ
jgi:hypothetical protein